MSHHCDHRCDDPLNDEFVGDECEKNLLANNESSCTRCRKLSTSSSILSYESKLKTWTEDINSTAEIEEFSANVVIPSIMFPQTRLSLNSGDNTEAPLLDRYTNIPLQNGHVHNVQEHCHSKPFRRHSSPWRQLLAASLMCLIFMLAEIVGGHLAGSLAVMTDAAHLLSDFVGFLVSMFSIWIGQRAPTKRLSFGFYRAEILGALLSVAIIWVLTGIFIYISVLRLLQNDFEINADTMMLVAGIGIIINIIMGLTLHGICLKVSHGHSHKGLQSNRSHSHNYNQKDVPGNINVRAAVIHVVGDLIQSIGVFVAAIVIKNYPSAKLADPICTCVFSLIVLFTTVPVLRDSINVLMEGFPHHFEYTDILKAFCNIEGVQTAHNLHIWSLTLDKYALAVHLAINNTADSDVVLKSALKYIRRELEIEIATVQVERYLFPTMENCVQCRPLPN
ncbi:zinc transporter 2-like [Athalia rosae]|uniref:zinc transporter 2-like n=1 Tax=Athalia rosae TaxID=37344 RepID=UPI0006251F20|nr:zinc transporter 2-like [Athalia rosae]XP_048513852.1 zinc transporter 2-like [Athalia rosae]XP_048513853.1 zinc transporter 2-like [Athalia rosae]